MSAGPPALAVIIGVAFTAGTLMLTDTMSKIFNDLSANVYKGTDAQVRAKAVFTNMGSSERPNVDASLVPALSHVPGVAAAEGSAFGYTRLIGKDGTPIGNPGGPGAPSLGGNWSTDPRLNPFQLVAGHAPQAPDEVVIDKHSATVGHLAVGDTTTVLANGPPLRVRIAGIAVFGTADSPAGASVVLFTTPVAQRLVTAPGTFSSISFVAAPGVSQQQLVSNLQRVLPPGTEAVTGAKVVKETQDSFQQGLSFFSKFLLIFAVIALVVGAFIIMNTFAITVAQRTRENGLLRALGASRRQVLGSVLIEAVAVGVIAAVIGLAAGVAVAAGLKAVLSVLGFGLPSGSLVLSARTVVVSLLVGLGVTVVAAISPARKAAKVPPVAAMQEATVYSGDATKHHLKLGDPVPVVFRDTGPQTLRVALIYGDNQAAPSPGAGSKASYFLGTPAYNANFAAPHYDSQVFVKKAPGVTTAAALAAVQKLAAQYAPGTTVLDEATYKAQQTKGVNTILALIYTLLALAIVIALIGIGNTLALSIFERTRELGVMRAVGMTRRQLRSTIRWESVIIALQGTVLGLVVGVFFGWALVTAQKNQGLTVFSVPYLTLIIVIVLAGVAGVAAAILPSRRAAKLNVLRAIVTE